MFMANGKRWKVNEGARWRPHGGKNVLSKSEFKADCMPMLDTYFTEKENSLI